MLYVVFGITIIFIICSLCGVDFPTATIWILAGLDVGMFIPVFILHKTSTKRGLGEGEIQDGTLYVPYIEMADGTEFCWNADRIESNIEDGSEGPVVIEAIVQDDFKNAMWYFKLLNFRGIAPTVTLYVTKK